MEIQKKNIQIQHHFKEEISIQPKNIIDSNLVIYVSNTDYNCRTQELQILQKLPIAPLDIFVNLEKYTHCMNSIQLLWYILESINNIIDTYPKSRILNIVIFLDGDKLSLQNKDNKNLLEFYNIFGNKIIEKIQYQCIELINCQVFHSTNDNLDYNNLGLGFLNVNILSKKSTYNVFAKLQKMSVFQYQNTVLFLPNKLKIYISGNMVVPLKYKEVQQIINIQDIFGKSIYENFNINITINNNHIYYIITNKFIISDNIKFQINIMTSKKINWKIYAEQINITNLMEEKSTFIYSNNETINYNNYFIPSS